MPWSSWQAPWLAPRDITTSGKYFAYATAIGSDPSPTADIPTLAAAAKAAVLAGSGTAGTSFGSSEKLATTAGNRFGSSGSAATVALGYSACVFAGGDGDPFLPTGTPPLLEAGTLGVDYDYIPSGDATANTSGFVDYETSGQSFDHWDVFHGSFLLHLSMTATVGTLVPDTLSIPLRFWGSTALAQHAGDATDGPAFGYAPSNVIGDFDFAAVGAPGFTADFFDNVPDTDISGQAETFTLVTQTRWEGADAVWSEDIPDTTSNFALNVFTRGTGSATCRGRYTTSRWRYWIPGGGPLRTVGDHFRSVGGADIKSLIPGVGWVKVRRGT